MKFRDHRTGFDTTMFASKNAEGHLVLSLHYRTPKCEAIIELCHEHAHALGAWLLDEFPYDAQLVNAAVQSGEYASKGEARRAFGINEGLPPMDTAWRRRIVGGLAGASPALPRPRVSYWRNLWNAIRGRR